MASLSHCHFPTPISYYITPKTPTPIFSFHYTLPFPTSILRSLSQPKFISLPRCRRLSRSTPKFSAGEFSGTTIDDDDLPEELVELPEELENQIDDYSDDDDVDVVALEREAKEVALEYSSSLSRVLTIEDERSDVKETGKNSKRSKPKRKIIPDNLLPRIAIVGRPNVGKSALFNRLVGGNKAIVVDEPGVTRDRLYGRSYWGDHEFMVVDTGGVLTVSKSQTTVMEDLDISTTIGMDGIPLASREAAVARMPSMIERQAIAAVEESPAIIFLVDGQAGLTAADVEIADWLRKNYSNKSIILAVNKCESPRKRIMQVSEFWSLGLEPIPISAISGTGTGDLLDLVCSGLQKVEVDLNILIIYKHEATNSKKQAPQSNVSKF